VRLGTISTSGKVTSFTGDTTRWIKHPETDYPRIPANHSVTHVLQSTSLTILTILLKKHLVGMAVVFIYVFKKNNFRQHLSAYQLIYHLTFLLSQDLFIV
jgi:hypothetical protein